MTADQPTLAVGKPDLRSACYSTTTLPEAEEHAFAQAAAVETTRPAEGLLWPPGLRMGRTGPVGWGEVVWWGGEEVGRERRGGRG